MATLLDQIDHLANQLKEMLPIKPEDKQRLDKKFRLEFNYNSNHLEGNTLTYGETELLLIFDDTKGNHTMREYEEMKAHDVAWHFVEELALDKERPLTERDIKNLNEMILVRPFWKDAETQDGQNTRRLIKVGDYKEYPNHVRLQNGEMFYYATPTDTPILMQELIEWYRAEQGNMHPVMLAAMLHYKFVRIHPFDDGNGRVSRLLMNYVLLRNGLPPVIIKTDDKANYLRALNRADVGDYAAFVEYIAEQAVWSLQLSLKAARGESVDEAGDFSKEVKLLKQKASGLDETKAPKLVYKIFKEIDNSLWKKISETLSQLDSLFSDNNTSHFVNGNRKEFEKYEFPTLQSLTALTRVYTDAPKNLKIFGYDIYETDIYSVKWNNVRYGLKGSKVNGEFETNLNILFDLNTYTIKLSANKNVIFEESKKYSDLFFTDTANKMNNLFEKYILEELKKRIGIDE